MGQVGDVDTVGDPGDKRPLRNHLVETRRGDRGEFLVDEVGPRHRAELPPCAVEVGVGVTPTQTLKRGIERPEALSEPRTDVGNETGKAEPGDRGSCAGDLDRDEV